MSLSLDRIQCKVTEEKPCSVTLEVQVPSDLVSAQQEQTLQSFQKKAQLPGFRTGKAPLDLIRKNFADRAKTEAIEDLLREVIPAILEDKKVSVVDTPQVQKLDFSEDQSLLFTVYVERSPEFKVKNYEGIKIERKVKEVTDTDVQKELDSLRERNSTLQFSEAEIVEKNHFAVIDYQGSLDGKEDSDLKAEHQLVDMATPQTVPGFAEGILGMKRGETKQVPVTFPQDYAYKKLAGKAVEFKITLQDIKEKKLPAADDELAKDFGYENLEALRADILKSLQSSLEKSQQGDIERQIIDHLDKENPIPVPESLIKRQTELMVNQFLRSEYGRSFESQSQQDQEKKRAELLESLRPEAEKMVRTSYLLEDVTRTESLQATEADFVAELEKVKASNPDKIGEIDKYFEEKKSNILNRLTEGKVFEFLKNKGKITDIKE